MPTQVSMTRIHDDTGILPEATKFKELSTQIEHSNKGRCLSLIADNEAYLSMEYTDDGRLLLAISGDGESSQIIDLPNTIRKVLTDFVMERNHITKIQSALSDG